MKRNEKKATEAAEVVELFFIKYSLRCFVES